METKRTEVNTASRRRVDELMGNLDISHQREKEKKSKSRGIPGSFLLEMKIQGLQAVWVATRFLEAGFYDDGCEL